VGDPKQSIYAFRRADIQAYLDVIEKMILKQEGKECRLTTNFRSHSGILDVVNGVFDKLILPRAGLQPRYVAIDPAQTLGPAPTGLEELPFRKVVIRQVESAENLSARKARKFEAESLARWLREEVLGKACIVNREQKKVPVQPKDVALLFRKLTEVHFYLEPLRRMGIGYVVEGERHFYGAQEIIDAVNLLRSIENPYDKTALVGLLRSPIGGLTDAEIYDLHRHELLRYPMTRKASGEKARILERVKDLYETLDRLRARTRALPVGEAVNLIFDTIPIRILASCSFNGEQAVANLEKLREQAGILGREGLGTLKEVVTTLEQRVLDLKEEGESALAEENVDAVRILSVHKAKGLEFPVVILVDAGATTDHREAGIWAQHDWSTELVGLRIRDYCNLEGAFLAEKRRLREEEEQKRVLYVAMTRAREHLMISCAPRTTKKNDGSFYSLLEQSLGNLSLESKPALIAAGKGNIQYQTISERLAAPQRIAEETKAEAAQNDWRLYFALWEKRNKSYEAARQTPIFLTPTMLKQSETESAGALPYRARSEPGSDQALLIGSLAHRFLQGWNFSTEGPAFEEELAFFLEQFPDDALGGERDRLRKELTEIFEVFFASAAYREVSTARILGREVPFLIPWDGCLMEGVIDLIYETHGRLYLADYKTDQVERKNLQEAALFYRHQVQIYSTAARRSLGRDVAGFKLIFLRLGESIELSADSHAVQYSLFT
jgi:ATP-dependent helicase/nuclease subunit A